MGRLHDRMAEDLRLRNFSPTTQRNYLFYARRFAAFFMRSPEELGEAEIRQFLLHQIEVKHLSYPAYRQIYAALKFLYTVTLKRAWEVEHLPFPKPQHRPLPVVLHPEELVTLFQAVRHPKYRTLFMTCYAAGLRIDEACHLRIADIDSKQMLVHVRQAKGGQERVTLLSAKKRQRGVSTPRGLLAVAPTQRARCLIISRHALAHSRHALAQALMCLSSGNFPQAVAHWSQHFVQHSQAAAAKGLCRADSVAASLQHSAQSTQVCIDFAWSLSPLTTSSAQCSKHESHCV